MPLSDRESEPNRFVDLLDCLADLMVETAKRREAISRLPDSPDPRIRDAVERMLALQDAMKQVRVEAASVHQLLEHSGLI